MVYWYLAFPVIACLVVSVAYPRLRKTHENETHINWNAMSVVYLGLIPLLGTAFFTFNPLSFVYVLALMILVPVVAGLRLPAVIVIPVLLLGSFLTYQGPYREATEFKARILNYQQQYPLVSIEDRLSYEAEAPVGNWQQVSVDESDAGDGCGEEPESTSPENQLPLLADIKEPLVAPPAANGLVLLNVSYGDSFDQMYYSEPQDRREALAIVHGGWERRFAVLMGQGVFRMRWMHDWEDHLEEGAEEQKLYLPDEYTPADQFEADVMAAQDIMSDKFRGSIPDRPDSRAHVQAVLNFVNPPGWGYVKSRNEVAGFQSHRFRSRPVVLDDQTGELDTWRITRLELVSLLKHKTPQVYLEGQLPDLEEFDHADVPTRPLDEFEVRALKFMELGKDIVIDERTDHVRMFGSLRAVQDCLQCHDVPENTLLGAFTYELRKPHVSLSRIE